MNAVLIARQEGPPPPPPRPSQAYLDENMAPEMLAVNGTLFALAMTCVLMRVYVRAFMLKTFGIDDWVMVFSAVCSQKSIVTDSCLLMLIFLPVGRKRYLLRFLCLSHDHWCRPSRRVLYVHPPGALVPFLQAGLLLCMDPHYRLQQHQNLDLLVFATIGGSSEDVALCFVRHHQYVPLLERQNCANRRDSFPRRIYHRISTFYCSSMYSSVRCMEFHPTTTLWVSSRASPVTRDRLTKCSTAKCYSTDVFRSIGVFNSSMSCHRQASPWPELMNQPAINLATDLLLALLPVPMVWNLQTNIRTRISLCIVLGLGLLYGHLS
jgi:hypothetical protein